MSDSSCGAFAVQAETRAAESEARAVEAVATVQVLVLLRSDSWRITAPLRWVYRLVGSCGHLVVKYFRGEK